MSAYYNEHDPKAAAWLRELIKEGHIAPGEVDERSICDVRATDLVGFAQCHFFAGIGGWSHAFRLAGIPDDAPVWSGSCPCQPFSDAGKGLAEKDPRHLWPEFYRLIAERGPAITFGEQVASKLGREWIAGVRADVERLGSQFGAADLCAAGAGAPHIRQRLWWVAFAAGVEWSEWGALLGDDAQAICGDAAGAGDAGGLAVADGRHTGAKREQRGGEQRLQPEDGGTRGMADDTRERWHGPIKSRDATGRRIAAGDGATGRLGDAEGGGRGECGDAALAGRGGHVERAGRPGLGAWGEFDILPCRDGKARRVEAGTFPLAHGVQGRVGLLRGYGNAIVPQVAAHFIQAALEALSL